MSQIFVWTLRDVLFVAMLLSALLVVFCMWVTTAFREWRCPHTSGVNETSACDAICRRCGKNLGFIGTWREGKK